MDSRIRGNDNFIDYSLRPLYPLWQDLMLVSKRYFLPENADFACIFAVFGYNVAPLRVLRIEYCGE
jgi:hypothetical protein